MRATAFDQKSAFLMGISVRKIFSLSWVLASVVASIGGIFLASLSVFGKQHEHDIGLKVFLRWCLAEWTALPARFWRAHCRIDGKPGRRYLSKVFGSGVKELSAFFILYLILMIKP